MQDGPRVTGARAASACSTLLLAQLLGFAAAAGALDFVVTKTADTADGACDADCSLREAVIAANAHPGGDRVLLGAGTFTLTIAGPGEDAAASGDLDLTDDVQILGLGAQLTVIDGNQLEQVIQVDPFDTNPSVELWNLEITGGIGGIRNWGTLTVVRCSIRGNTTLYDGAGIDTEDAGYLLLVESTVSDNGGGDGGGLGSLGGHLEVHRSTISGNHGYLGGGIFSQGHLELYISTVSGNVAGGAGGAIYATGEVDLAFSTIADNLSPAGQFDVELLGTPFISGNTLILGDCHRGSGVTTQSLGGNLESPGDTCLFIAPTDQVLVADAMLGGLEDNGGRTWTHAPLPGSPAIDHGLGTVAISRDQRWAPRPFDGDGDGQATSDTGAVESIPGWIFSDDFEILGTFAWSATFP